ncbi:MAG TPA: site-specific integrase, partial [Nitratidesulfovibrio sp.]|nr:site-specific integrase [Nitratidesulfovibrio sp.]
MMDVFRLADAYLTATAKGQVMHDPTTPESILTNERIRAIADRLLKDILDETYRTRFRDVPKVLDTFAWAEMRGILAGEAIERWHENDLDAYKANVDAELESEGINDIPRNSIPYLKLCRAVAAIDYAVNLAASRPSFDGTLDKAAQESYESHVGIPKLPHPSQTVAPTQGTTPVYGTSHGTSYGTLPSAGGTLGGTLSPTPCGTATSGLSPAGQALPLLSEAVATYLRMHEGQWSPTTMQDKERMVGQFKGICIEFHGGDFPIDQLGWEMVQHYSNTFPKLPTGASAEVRNGKTYRELAAKENDKTITPTTVENNFTAVRAFLNWAEALYPIRVKILIKQLKFPEVVDRAQSLVTLPGQRRPYTRDELAAVFAPEPYLAATKKHPARFWLPLIALFTGARVEEIAQLHREDIRQEKGVWIFDINDAGDKRLKTKASRRHVPVHPLLTELGFLDFVNRTPKGQKRVFHSLTPDSRMKYGHSVTKWYTRYRREQGIGGNTGEKSELDLHAFRHL